MSDTSLTEYNAPRLLHSHTPYPVHELQNENKHNNTMSDTTELKQQVDKATELLVKLQLENMELRRKLWAAKLASHQPTSPIHPYTK